MRSFVKLATFSLLHQANLRGQSSYLEPSVAQITKLKPTSMNKEPIRNQLPGWRPIKPVCFCMNLQTSHFLCSVFFASAVVDFEQQNWYLMNSGVLKVKFMSVEYNILCIYMVTKNAVILIATYYTNSTKSSSDFFYQSANDELFSFPCLNVVVFIISNIICQFVLCYYDINSLLFFIGIHFFP